MSTWEEVYYELLKYKQKIESVKMSPDYMSNIAKYLEKWYKFVDVDDHDNVTLKNGKKDKKSDWEKRVIGLIDWFDDIDTMTDACYGNLECLFNHVHRLPKKLKF